MTRAATFVGLLLLCSLLVFGCGGDDDDGSKDEGSNRAAAYEAPDDGTNEVPIEKGSVEGQDALTAQAQEGELTEEDYAEYEEGVEAMAYLLDSYWEEAFAEEDETYEPPTDVYGYYPGEDFDVLCGGEDAATPENAFYCGDTDEIAWDEPGLFLPYYFERGELAVGIVMAHEWAHLVQNRAEEQFPITYEQELNADCLAGAWLAGLEREGLLDGVPPGGGGDIDLALDTIFSLGDSPDTPFEDPQAHGQPEERAEAVEFGYTDELDGCFEEYAPGFAQAKGIKIPKGAAAAEGDALGG